MNFSTEKGRKRVLGSMLAQNVGETVCLLGSLVQLDSSGRTLKMKSSDDQLVTVQLQEPPNAPIEKFLEVHGTVSSGNTISCFKCIPFESEMSENFDMDLYNEAVNVVSEHPDWYTVMN